MDLILLSDVHYGAFDDSANREIESDLLSLIDYCEETETKICILGDLFDFWMEYPGHIPNLGSSIRDRFERFNKKFGPTLYITGNHDNWTLGYFKKIGFDVETDYRRLTLDNQHIFLHHGDGLSDPSFGLNRPFLHRILRNKWFVQGYRTLLPPATGLWLMEKFSNYSRSQSRLNPKRLSDWSEKFLESSEIDVVISGHDHLPRIETFDFGTYINLGTFYKHRTVVHYTNGTFKLVVWNGDQKRTTLFEDLIT